MQLYEQIEKEFDEKFFIAGKNAYGEEVGLLFPAKVEVRDFLKQSFIKFLDGECERLEMSKKLIRKQCRACGGTLAKSHGSGAIVFPLQCIVCHNYQEEPESNAVGYNQAKEEVIADYQNMIKELQND